jgi:hypothetical protein
VRAIGDGRLPRALLGWRDLADALGCVFSHQRFEAALDAVMLDTGLSACRRGVLGRGISRANVGAARLGGGLRGRWHLIPLGHD